MDKKRSPNFTHDEDQLLVALVQEKKNVIECKKTNVISWKEKENTWKEIENQFNTNCNVFRDKKCLKNRFKNLKKNSKKKYSQNKQNMCLTGGGQGKVIDINDIDETIKEIIGDDQIVGMSCNYDSDVILKPNYESEKNMCNYKQSDGVEESTNVDQYEEENIIIQYEDCEPQIEDQNIDDPSTLEMKENDTENNWSSYSSQKLKRPVSAKLNVSKIAGSKTIITEKAKKTRKYIGINYELIEEKLNFVKLQREKFLEEHALKIDLLKKRIALEEKKLNS